MIKYLVPFILSEKEEENSSLAEWAFQSHYWIEKAVGYYECKWCKRMHTSVQGINKEFPLCLENLVLKKRNNQMKQNFEQFLMEKHAEDYIGTKDCMIDDFSDWLSNLSLDEFIEYGDQFAKEQSKELLEVCKQIREWFEGENFVYNEELQKAIAKAGG